MTTRLISVATEPVTLAEAREQCRIDADITDEDSLLSMYVTAARELAEQHCKSSFAACEWELKLDEFPLVEIRLDWSPVQSVSYVKYIDVDQVEQTVDAADYVLDSHNKPAWVIPGYGLTWPQTLDSANAVTVRYFAGDATACPAAVKTWILLHVAHWYKNRESATDRQLYALPFLAGLLDRSRVY